MEPITTTPLDLDELHTAMERGDVAQISRLVADLYPAEIARLIESLPAEERRALILFVREMPDDILAEVREAYAKA